MVDPYADDWPFNKPSYRWQSDVRKLPSGRMLEIEYLDTEFYSPISRYIRGVSGPQAVRDGTLRTREREITRIMDGDVPGGRFSTEDMAWILWCFMPDDPSKITSMELLLTVANLTKYTAGEYIRPDDFGMGWDPAQVERIRRRNGTGE